MKALIDAKIHIEDVTGSRDEIAGIIFDETQGVNTTTSVELHRDVCRKAADRIVELLTREDHHAIEWWKTSGAPQAGEP